MLRLPPHRSAAALSQQFPWSLRQARISSRGGNLRPTAAAVRLLQQRRQLGRGSWAVAAGRRRRCSPLQPLVSCVHSRTLPHTSIHQERRGVSGPAARSWVSGWWAPKWCGPGDSGCVANLRRQQGRPSIVRDQQMGRSLTTEAQHANPKRQCDIPHGLRPSKLQRKM